MMEQAAARFAGSTAGSGNNGDFQVGQVQLKPLCESRQ
jgi:hypothetical protein